MVIFQANPGEEDFAGYMEQLERQRASSERLYEQLAEHEKWRQNTFGGFVVRQLQSLGQHFAPFFLAVSDLMEKQQNKSGSGAAYWITIIGLRVLVITTCVVAVYAFAAIISSCIGRDIVIEQEVIVEDEGDAKPTSSGKKRVSKRRKEE